MMHRLTKHEALRVHLWDRLIHHIAVAVRRNGGKRKKRRGHACMVSFGGSFAQLSRRLGATPSPALRHVYDAPLAELVTPIASHPCELVRNWPESVVGHDCARCKRTRWTIDLSRTTQIPTTDRYLPPSPTDGRRWNADKQMHQNNISSSWQNERPSLSAARQRGDNLKTVLLYRRLKSCQLSRLLIGWKLVSIFNCLTFTIKHRKVGIFL